MRLYLSSETLGERAGALLALLGGGTRIAVIANGYDGASEMARELYRTEIHDPITAFSALGLTAEHLDLRAYFDDPERLKTRLSAFDLVWVMGGNSFVLRRAMRASGFDHVIRDLLNDDAIAYGGYGAGAVVAGPNLRGLELMDDPWEVPEGYDEAMIWGGLGLTEFSIVPHYRSQHPEAAAAEKLASYHKAKKSRFRALSDGEVIVQVGEKAFERVAS